jgi:hypothetical protein
MLSGSSQIGKMGQNFKLALTLLKKIHVQEALSVL